jgi:hypothetical protein
MADNLHCAGSVLMEKKELPMKRQLILSTLSLALLAAAPLANAKGCLKGALVGGAAGHVAGHHGVLGAAAGCAIGHHRAHKQDQQHQQTAQQTRR